MLEILDSERLPDYPRYLSSKCDHDYLDIEVWQKMNSLHVPFLIFKPSIRKFITLSISGYSFKTTIQGMSSSLLLYSGNSICIIWRVGSRMIFFYVMFCYIEILYDKILIFIINISSVDLFPLTPGHIIHLFMSFHKVL